MDPLRASLQRAESTHAEFPGRVGSNANPLQQGSTREQLVLSILSKPVTSKNLNTRSLSPKSREKRLWFVVRDSMAPCAMKDGLCVEWGSVKCGNMIPRILAVFPSPLLLAANVRHESMTLQYHSHMKAGEWETGPTLHDLKHRRTHPRGINGEENNDNNGATNSSTTYPCGDNKGPQGP